MAYFPSSAFIVAALLIAACTALPQQQATDQQQPLSQADQDAINRCDAPVAMEETVNCWMADKDGNWLTGPDVLDAQTPLKNADWQQFVDTAFRTERNITKAANRIFQSTGGLSSIMLGFALQADEAIYGEQAPDIRGKMCGGLQALMGCISKHAGARCQEVVNTRIERLPMRFGMSDLRLPTTAKFDSVMQLVAKILCYICDEKNEREGLKVLLGTALDGNKRKMTQDLMKSDNRVQVYRQCTSAPLAQTRDAPRTSQEYLQLMKDRPCEFYPYFHCLAQDVQAKVNPGVEFNALDGIGNITFNHVFACNTATVPNYGTCPQVEDVETQFKSGGALPTGRARAVAGDGSPSQPNAAVQMSSSFFAVLLAVAFAFLSLAN